MGCISCKPVPIDFDAEVSLDHFDLLRSVGKGAFGKVRVVQHKRTKKHYALKYINKESCIKMQAIENILRERRLLVELDHLFLCNLRYAFQDDENLFMVLDLMLGGDLRFHLERRGSMKEDVVQFYVACVSLALDNLHSKNIVHRDLKPDNILLCENGFAHVSDFNIATRFEVGIPLKSTAGSRAYMAPEILFLKGYYNSVDWWSLGIVAYELLFGKRPFRGKNTDSLSEAIKTSELIFPSHAVDSVSPAAIDFISKLLVRDSGSRLACGPLGFGEIQSHPWFDGFDWSALKKKKLVAPFIPDPKKSNFDATHELEELLLEENPLRHTRRKNNDPNRKGPPLTKEMLKLENEFDVYDYAKVQQLSVALDKQNARIAAINVDSGFANSQLSANIGNADKDLEAHVEPDSSPRDAACSSSRPAAAASASPQADKSSSVNLKIDIPSDIISPVDSLGAAAANDKAHLSSENNHRNESYPVSAGIISCNPHLSSTPRRVKSASTSVLSEGHKSAGQQSIGRSPPGDCGISVSSGHEKEFLEIAQIADCYSEGKCIDGFLSNKSSMPRRKLDEAEAKQ